MKKSSHRQRRFEGMDQVALIISPGYGSGWWTWNQQHPDLLFDSFIVDILLNKPRHDDWEEKIVAYCKLKYNDCYIGTPLTDLTVVWVPKGKKFRIVENDGYERIEFRDDIDWMSF